jgi:imidazolonepropionase-like amidohydrolase
VPQGAEEADGVDDLTRVVRDQIGHGADVVKVYGDYRWGGRGEAEPTFSLDEMTLIVETAKSSGRPVVVHASTPEGMRRATLAGAETIEHGDGGTPEIYKLMVERNVALCATLAAGDATSQYAGWKKGGMPEPPSITRKRASFKAALDAGVTSSMAATWARSRTATTRASSTPWSRSACPRPRPSRAPRQSQARSCAWRRKSAR